MFDMENIHQFHRFLNSHLNHYLKLNKVVINDSSWNSRLKSIHYRSFFKIDITYNLYFHFIFFILIFLRVHQNSIVRYYFCFFSLNLIQSFSYFYNLGLMNNYVFLVLILILIIIFSCAFWFIVKDYL